MKIASEEFNVADIKHNISIQTNIYHSVNSESNNKYLGLCAVILHPHPLYGGEMRNNVVQGIKNVLTQQGICCVTFNFRGVGRSSGEFGDGFGEQEDLLNVSNFVLNKFEHQEVNHLILIGYSFGAFITLAAANKIEYVKGIALLSHPFGLNSKIPINYKCNLPKLFVNGTQDNIALYSHLLEEFDKFSEPKYIKPIENADHFYFGYEIEAGEEILKFINSIL